VTSNSSKPHHHHVNLAASSWITLFDRLVTMNNSLVLRKALF